MSVLTIFLKIFSKNAFNREVAPNGKGYFGHLMHERVNIFDIFVPVLKYTCICYGTMTLQVGNVPYIFTITFALLYARSLGYEAIIALPYSSV